MTEDSSNQQSAPEPTLSEEEAEYFAKICETELEIALENENESIEESYGDNPLEEQEDDGLRKKARFLDQKLKEARKQKPLPNRLFKQYIVEVRAAEQTKVELAKNNFPQKNQEKAEEVIAKGNKALEKLVKANLGLVFSNAQRYVRIAPDLSDELVQNGMIALSRAARNYNPSLTNSKTGKPYKFSTLATKHIRFAMIHAIAENRYKVHIPKGVLDAISCIDIITREWEQAGKEKPSSEEISKALENKGKKKINAKKIDEILSFKTRCLDFVNLDSPIGEDKEATLNDCIEDESARGWDESVAEKLKNEHLRAKNENADALTFEGWEKKLHSLSKVEQLAFCSYFGYQDIKSAVNDDPHDLIEDLPSSRLEIGDEAAKTARREHARELAEKMNQLSRSEAFTPANALLIERRMMAKMEIGLPDTSFDLWCIGWIKQKNSRPHTDYWMLDMLAFMLYRNMPPSKNAVNADWKASYNAFVSMEIFKDGRKDLNDTKEIKSPLVWWIKKEARKQKGGNANISQSDILNLSLDSVSDTINSIKGKSIWNLFFDEGTKDEVSILTKNLRKALNHDSIAQGREDYLLQEARVAIIAGNLLDAIQEERSDRGEKEELLSDTLRLLVIWMLGIQDEGVDSSRKRAREGLETGGGEHFDNEHDAPDKKAGLIVRVKIARENGSLTDASHQTITVNPFEKGSIGFGHNFVIKANGGPIDFGQAKACHRTVLPGIYQLIDKAWGIVNLPAQTEDKNTGMATSPVSRYHCALIYNRMVGGWRLFDLNSTCGTMITRTDSKTGAKSTIIAGLGWRNSERCKDLGLAEESPTSNCYKSLEALAARTGAIIQAEDEEGSISDAYSTGVPIAVGDVICLGFQIANDDGSVTLKPRNGACVIEVSRLV